MSKFITLALFLTLIFSYGCATKRTAGWDQSQNVEKMSSKEARKTYKKAMSAWKKRDNKDSLKTSLELFEKLSTSEKKNYKYMALLSRGYYLLADGHTSDMSEKKRLWEVGISWGEKAMATNDSFKKAMVKEEGRVENALNLLTKNEIESIYWTAVNLGKWGKNSGIATILKYKTRIKKMINRVGELDPNFFHGAFHRYWGAYYAVAPSFAGGDIEKSYESFEKAISAEKNYLGTYVLYAELYATKKGNKDLFKKKLEYVLKANPNKLSVIAPENKIEQAKAKRLLSNIDELF